LINIKSSTLFKGILWGALFFCPYFLLAQEEPVNSDRAEMQDTTRYMRNIIKQRKGIVMDSSLKSLSDTVLILNDSILLQNDTSLIRDDTILIRDDSITLLNESTVSGKKNKREHSPPRATILSAVIPGMGQAYNRKYWKIPIIYAAGGAMYYYLDNYCNPGFKKWKDVYETEFAKGPDADQRVINQAVANRDLWSKRRGYTVIFMGLLYVANVVDAMVDAYFLSFNVSDDLSLRIEPNLDQIPFQYAFDNFSYGVKLSFNF
jgi:hypothetical protein